MAPSTSHILATGGGGVGREVETDTTVTTAPSKTPITLSGNIFSPQFDKEDLTAEAHHNAPLGK